MRLPFAPRSPRLLALTLLVGALLLLFPAAGASAPRVAAHARTLPLALTTTATPHPPGRTTAR